MPTIVQLELVKWLTREAGEDLADSTLAFTQTCAIVPLDTSIAVAAAAICAEMKLSTADAIVYATAKLHDADLITCDRDFDGLPGISYIRKSTN